MCLPVPSGVERVGRWLWCGQLSHRNGRIPAGCALRLHWLQVSGSLKEQLKESFSKSAATYISFPPRVQKECLAFSPLLPSDISELCIRGVNYLGCRMDWLLRKDDVCVILRQQAGSVDSNAKSCNLQVVLKDSGMQIPLMPGNTNTNSLI